MEVLCSLWGITPAGGNTTSFDFDAADVARAQVGCARLAARMACTFTALCVKSGFDVMRDVMRGVMRHTFKYLVVCKSTSCIANLVCISTSMVLLFLIFLGCIFIMQLQTDPII